jgi:hypothetical protein
MIDMGMGQHDIGYDLGIKGQDTIFFSALFAAPLIQATIQQNPILFSRDEMHRTSHFTNRAIKSYIHMITS